MTIRTSKTKSFLSLLLSSALVLGGLAIPVFSQREKPIVISFGQPNIWSLEQAHYLLARMHRQNLDLQTATLGDLDPNATNASRIDILKTLLEAGVKFDQAVALNNQLLKNDKVFNSQRRQELLAKRSTLQDESTQLARDIAALKIAKAAAKTDDDRTPIQDQIDAKTEEKAAVDNELAQTNTEITGLTSASGNFTSVEAPGSFNSDSLKGDLDTLISKVQLINPSIAATLRLDNHIQMQYEIIAKQLTLLRDEVGSGERLVFLELPQSVNATQDKAEDKVAQVWWRIAGYTRVDKEKLLEHEQRDLGQKIADMNIIREQNEKLAAKYDKNKDDLIIQLNSLCAKKAEVELNIEKTQKLIDETQKSNREADEKLANAKKSKAECDQKLAAAQKSVDDEHQKLIKARTRAQKRAVQRLVKRAQDEAMRVGAECSAANETLRLAEEAKAAAVAGNAHLCEQLDHTLDQLQASIKQFDGSIRETREGIQKVDDRQVNLQKETAKVVQAYTSLSTKYEKLTLEVIKKRIAHQRDRADRLLQGGGANTAEVVDKTIDLLNQKFGLKKAQYGNNGRDKDGREYALKQDEVNDEGRRYVNLDQSAAAGRSQDQSQTDDTGQATLRNRSVRTIDIIPRQNALNINDTKQRVSKTGIFAAFSFLFGFAGKFNYERQHEQAQQFLNQELFTSGFGKGDTDFGWNFYPYGGTKQLAPGVRTTYAVAVIPEDAETLVLKAKGCYFPRKQNQPLNYDLAGGPKWSGDARSSNCSEEEQVFVIPVPGGSGDGADYYVTGMWFSPNRKPGERIVASIYGQNFPTQLGVLINGVPLTESVGLGQLGIESILADKVRENCVGQICGRFERIDPNQIVLSFSMPADFKNTPQIALIGPGKEIEINKLYLNINGVDDTQLDSAGWMFGKPTKLPSRTIADFKVAPSTSGMNGVLSGGDFKPGDTIYVNGAEAKPSGIACKRLDLCVISFPAQATDYLTVTVSPADKDEEAVSRTFVNPTNLSIISASVVSIAAGDATHPPVLTVKLDGSGFKNALEVRIVKADGAFEEPQKLVPSAGQMILKVVSPEPVVQITVRDPDNNRSVSAVVVRPAE